MDIITGSSYGSVSISKASAFSSAIRVRELTIASFNTSGVRTIMPTQFNAQSASATFGHNFAEVTAHASARPRSHCSSISAACAT